MIVTRLAHADRYAPLHPLLARGFDWLRRFDADTPEGRHDILGDDLFASVQRYTTEPAEARRYESHQRYLDIQFLATGRELIHVCETSALAVTQAYDDANDLVFYGDPAGDPFGVPAAQRVALGGDVCCVLWPSDGHKPCCVCGAPGTVLKVVVKVRVG